MADLPLDGIQRPVLCELGGAALFRGSEIVRLDMRDDPFLVEVVSLTRSDGLDCDGSSDHILPDIGQVAQGTLRPLTQLCISYDIPAMELEIESRKDLLGRTGERPGCEKPS
jgi:hypothetical protein